MCTSTLEFPPKTTIQRRKERKRPLGNKLQEIAARAPERVYAIDTLADFILAELDAAEQQQQQQQAT